MKEKMGFKIKSNYKLNIGTELTLQRNLRKGSVIGGFSQIRKTIGIIIITMVAAMGIFAGLTVVPSATDGKANANLFVDWFCPTKEDPTVWLGGKSSEINRGLLQGAGAAPYEGMWGVAGFPKADITAIESGKNPTKRWTTLERFGYLSPTYSDWVGMAPYEEDIGGNKGTPWLGTGGDATGSVTGTPVLITNPKNSIFFTTNPFDCGMSSGSVAVGNIVSFFPKAAVALSSNLYIASQNLSLTDKNSSLKPVGDVLEKLIVGDGNTKGLKDLLFMDFMVVMILIGAVVVGVQGIIKGQGLQAMQSVAWMLIASIGGLIFMTNPLIISTVMESGISKVQSGIQSAVLQTSSQTPECSVGATQGEDLHREITCTIWFSTVYKPWVEGQFGFTYDQMTSDAMRSDPSITSGGEDAPTVAVSADDVQDFFKDGASMTETQVTYTGSGRSRAPKTTVVAVKDLNINTGTSSEASRGVFANFGKTVKLGSADIPDSVKSWPYIQLASQSEWPKSQGLNYSEVAYNQLVVNNNETWKHASNAPGSAFMSLLAAGGPVIFLTIIAGSLISFQIVLVFLIVLAPFFLTVGIVPGWGKRVTMRWLEMLVSLFIKRIILMTFLLLFMKIYMSIMNFQDMNWFIQTLFVIILTIVALGQKEQVTQMITSQINFGANMPYGDEREMKAAMVGGALVGVAAGKSIAKGGWKVGSGTASGVGSAFKRGNEKRKTKREKEEQQDAGSKVIPTSSKTASENTNPEATPKTKSTDAPALAPIDPNDPERRGWKERYAAGRATLAERAGVAQQKWGNIVQRVRMTREEARKASELRQVKARRKDILDKKQRLRDLPEGQEKQELRQKLSEENKERRNSQQAAIEKARAAKKENAARSRAPQAAANANASEKKAQEVRDRKEQAAREAAAKERKREKERQKRVDARAEAEKSSSPVPGRSATATPPRDNPGNVVVPNNQSRPKPASQPRASKPKAQPIISPQADKSGSGNKGTTPPKPPTPPRYKDK